MGRSFMGVRIAVIGSGGREHALAWALSKSPRVEQIFCLPGNAGMALEPKAGCQPIASDDIPAIVRFVKVQEISRIYPGPEGPLCAGLVDAVNADPVLAHRGVRVLGPMRKAAMITEGSKCGAKEFMARYGIPTPPFRCFDDLAAAREFIAEHELPVVVKADGLAAGKGTTIAHSREEAFRAAAKWIRAHGRIVVEDYLDGEEATFTCIVAGQDILPLATSQDHKRLWDGDRGPMTGGMGAVSPAPVAEGRMHRRIMETIVRPTVRGLASDGIPYLGFLYFGLMIAEGRPWLLEYNCRLGDPEAQAILVRLKSDLFEVLESAWVAGVLTRQELEWDHRPSVSIVVAASGYPEKPKTGDVIGGLEEVSRLSDVKVFHAGTALRQGAVVSAGGRVLGVTALGTSVAGAQALSRQVIGWIDLPGMHFRADIGHRAIERETAARRSW